MSVSMTMAEYEERCRLNLDCELEHARRKVAWWQEQVERIEAEIQKAERARAKADGA